MRILILMTVSRDISTAKDGIELFRTGA